MQTPRKKHSRSRRNMRRAHDGISAVQSTTCPNCGEMVLSHTACPSCGQYRGRAVVKTAKRD